MENFPAALFQEFTESGIIPLGESVFFNEKESLLYHKAARIFRLKNSGNLFEKYGLMCLGCRKFNPVAEYGVAVFSCRTQCPVRFKRCIRTNPVGIEIQVKENNAQDKQSDRTCQKPCILIGSKYTEAKKRPQHADNRQNQ